MTDFIADLFDPRTDLAHLPLDGVDTVNPAKARSRVLRLLREQPLPGERVPIVGELLDRIGVARMRAELGALAGDASVHAFNRAAPAILLMRDNHDPGVPAERLPVLIESIVVGAAIFGGVKDVAPYVAGLCALPATDVGALLARLEPWRRSLVLPGFMLYAGVLGSSGARRAHAQVLDVLERGPEADALVHAAREAGVLEPGLAEAFLARPPAAQVEAKGRICSKSRCGSCGASIYIATIHLGERGHVGVEAHLGGEDGTHVSVSPGISDAYVRALEEESDLEEEEPIGRLVATLSFAPAEDEELVRFRWLMRQFLPSGVPFDLTAERPARAIGEEDEFEDQAYYGPTPHKLLNDVRLAGDNVATEAFETAVDKLTDALDSNELSSPRTGAAWLPLVEVVLRMLEAEPLVWRRPVPPILLDAGSGLRAAVEGAVRDGALDAAVREVLSDARLDALERRQLLGWVCEVAGPDADLELTDWAAFARREEELLQRHPLTPRAMAAALGAPARAAKDLAKAFGVGVDEAVGG